MNISGADVEIFNSTFSGGRSDGSGSVLMVSDAASVKLVNCTIADCVADADNDGEGSGVFLVEDSATLSIGNCVVANNSLGNGMAEPLSGPLISLGGNVVDRAGPGIAWSPSDHTGTLESPLDPGLGSLTGNYYYYYPLLRDSPAINSGELALLPADNLYDNRGSGHPRILGSRIDAGAIEFPISIHSADKDGNGLLELPELLRCIQLFNALALHCEAGTEDGYDLGPGDEACAPHALDLNPLDWAINLSELLRAIQFYNSPGGYTLCTGSEDGFCPVA